MQGPVYYKEVMATIIISRVMGPLYIWLPEKFKRFCICSYGSIHS
jgi:hypothetical protein